MQPHEVHIVVIAGVRPQYIKMAALYDAIQQFNKGKNGTVHISAKYVNCNQHYSYQLAGNIINELGLRFDHTISHRERVPTRVMAEILVQSQEVISQMLPRPQWIVIFGDANTTLATTIAAKHSRLDVLHIEAGVRSNNFNTEEEINRRMVDHVSSLHFCSTRGDVQNLNREGIESAYFTGDLAYEFVLKSSQSSNYDPPYRPGYVLVTIHKSENFMSDRTLTNLIHVLSEFHHPVLFITHPKTRKKLAELNLLTQNITFCESIPYRKMLATIKDCRFLITDSGGLQREAHYLNKRCLVLRKKPGWYCLIELGFNRVISKEIESIQDGLDWVENKLDQSSYPSTSSPFYRPNGCDFALNLLVDKSQ